MKKGKGGKIEFTKKEIDKIIIQYVNKLYPIYKICKKFNIREKPIKRILIENGIIIPKGSPYSIEYWKQRGLSEKEAKYHISTLRPSNINYWLNKGYDEKTAKLESQAQRLETLESCIYKFGEEQGKRKWEEKIDKISKQAKNNFTGSLQHWLNKGYSEEESKQLVSEHQVTFSLEICIKKYGEENGLKRWEERQNKWLNTILKKYGDNKTYTYKQDANSMDFFKNKYKNEWVHYCLTERSFTNENRNIISAITINCKSTEDIVKYINKNIEYVSFTDKLKPIINSDILHDLFNTNFDELKKGILKGYGFKYFGRNTFSNVRLYNGKTYRSNGEYKIAKFLTDNDIKYRYDEKYCELKKIRYDFYLINYVYIFELRGLMHLNSNRDNIKRKQNYCIENNLNYFFSDNADEIINFIITLEKND